MDSGKKLAYDEVLGRRIVEMRQSGKKWKAIDAELFPGLVHRDTRSGSFAGDFCVKFRDKYPEVEGAFSKKVIGCMTATQIVIPLRKFNGAAQTVIHERITMADLGL